MTLVSAFRVIVIVGLLSGLYSGFAEYIYRPALTEDFAAFLEWDGFGRVLDPVALVQERPIALSITVVIALSLLVIATVVGPIAMLWFSHLGRTVTLVSTTIFVVLGPFFGVSAVLPIEGTAGYLATLCEGASLAIAYYSPLSKRFKSGTKSA